MESTLDHDSLQAPRRKCSQADDLDTNKVFCPHCKVHVSRRTFYRHQAMYDNAADESDRTFSFIPEEDSHLDATGSYI